MTVYFASILVAVTLVAKVVVPSSGTVIISGSTSKVEVLGFSLGFLAT